jgi:uncharacterized protein Veg
MRKAGLNIEEVKNKIRDLKGREVALNINRGRIKFDTLNGIIKDVYPSVFTIENQSAQLQTFSYYDVLCGNVIFL